MNTRHHKSLTSPLMTMISALNKYLVDKASQARRLVQVNYINAILGKGSILFYLGMQYLDGLDTIKRMQSCLYDIQAGSYLVAALEDEECKKRLNQNISKTEGKPKKRKHYGFDNHAVAHIDILCDEILSAVSSYGQKASGNTKESEVSTVES